MTAIPLGAVGDRAGGVNDPALQPALTQTAH
jgi:hypothetical protein